MLFLTGIFGKFVRQIPIGVILALTASLIEAFFILPQHVAHFVRPQDVSSAVGANLKGFAAIGEKFKHSWDHRVTPLYLRWLEKFVLRRWLTLSGAFALFVGTLLFAWIKMNFILFPPDGVETFFVRLQAPTTASLQTTENILRGVEEQILKLPQNELKDVVTTAGIHQNDPNDPNVKRGGHFGQIMVFLHPESGRTRTAQEIIDALKKDIPVPNGVVSMTYERAVSGPPVGKPISIAVRGDEMEDILRAVRDMETAVRKIPGAMDVTNSYYEGKEEVQVVVDPIETRAAQLTVAQVGNTVRGAYDGLLPTSIRLLDDDVKLRVSFTRDARSSQSSIEDILVPNAFGNLIPLASISKIKTSRSVSAFTHEANQREVRVLGEVDTQITSARAISAEISKLFPEFRKHHPKVEFSFGGEEEDTQESLASMVRAFILAAFGILFILILTFGNFLQPLLVLLSIPFGVVGVIWAFYFHGMPLSFMGILGIIALAGVIVNNAIVFIDFVNAGKEAGLDPFQSILKAGGARLRPIFLTTFTTVCGLMPTAYGIGGLDKFVVPIAMSLGWGMVVGSLLTAFVLPAAVLALEDVRTWILRTVGN
jgi:multidrug efflux pump subunit AcrB